jgi:hypothetical protein
MTTLTEEKNKVCKSCGTLFPSISYWGKEYCSLKCRNREKRHRHKARDLNMIPKVESPYFAEVLNPTVEQLNTYADMIDKEQTNDKPISFTGVIPMWTAPPTVIFNQQQGIDKVQWLMFHPAMLD